MSPLPERRTLKPCEDLQDVKANVPAYILDRIQNESERFLVETVSILEQRHKLLHDCVNDVMHEMGCIRDEQATLDKQSSESFRALDEKLQKMNDRLEKLENRDESRTAIFKSWWFVLGALGGTILFALKVFEYFGKK